jgi:hypothetical protein
VDMTFCQSSRNCHFTICHEGKCHFVNSIRNLNVCKMSKCQNSTDAIMTFHNFVLRSSCSDDDDDSFVASLLRPKSTSFVDDYDFDDEVPTLQNVFFFVNDAEAN